VQFLRKKWRKKEKIENKYLIVEYDNEINLDQSYGSKYSFNLDKVVDCPEFLVDKEVLTKLALEFHLELVDWIPFKDFYLENIKVEKHFSLLNDIYHIEPTLESVPLPDELRDIAELYVVITFKKLKQENEGDFSNFPWESFKDQDQPIKI